MFTRRFESLPGSHQLNMRVLKIISCGFAFTLLVTACSEEKKTEPKEDLPAQVVETKITDTTFFENNVNAFSDVVGVVGVFDIPEMLVLSIMDSSAKENLPTKMVDNYALLEKEMNEVGAEMNGAIGLISYTNKTENYIFETILCIRQIPKVQPKKSKIVVLESSKMLVFNFYGPYQNLFGAYDLIKRYCNKSDLIQSGPMREFYITDPAKEKNPEKWLTRIFLPVISMRK